MPALYGTGNWNAGLWPNAAAGTGALVIAGAASGVTFSVTLAPAAVGPKVVIVGGASGVSFSAVQASRHVYQLNARSSITFGASSASSMTATGMANVIISFDGWIESQGVVTWAPMDGCEPGTWTPWSLAA